MIKNYSNSKKVSNSVNFILKSAKKRRQIARNNANDVQNELGLAPMLFAVK